MLFKACNLMAGSDDYSDLAANYLGRCFLSFGQTRGSSPQARCLLDKAPRTRRRTRVKSTKAVPPHLSGGIRPFVREDYSWVSWRLLRSRSACIPPSTASPTPVVDPAIGLER